MPTVWPTNEEVKIRLPPARIAGTWYFAAPVTIATLPDNCGVDMRARDRVPHRRTLRFLLPHFSQEGRAQPMHSFAA
jgi:hypothetical protein